MPFARLIAVAVDAKRPPATLRAIAGAREATKPTASVPKWLGSTLGQR